MQHLLVSRLTIFSLVALLSGCHTSENAQASEGAPTPPATPLPAAGIAVPTQGAPQATNAEPRAKYDEEAFQLALAAPAAGKVGESVEVTVQLTAQSGYKVNPEYPIKFTFEASDAVSAELPVLKKEQGNVEKGKAELRGKVKLGKSGAQVIGGKLSFSVCTDERCLIEKRDLALPITVS